MLATPLLSLLVLLCSSQEVCAVPIDSPETSISTHETYPQSLPYRHEEVLASNKLASPPPLTNSGSFCFRPTISALTSNSCQPVLDAIRTLRLPNDDNAPFERTKTWTATTQSGSVYQWGVPRNPCKIKVVVDPALGPSVEVQDTFSKEDVWVAASKVVGDCVEQKQQAGRRALGANNGMFVTVGRLGRDEKI